MTQGFFFDESSVSGEPWTLELNYDGKECFVISESTKRRIPIKPRSPFPAHVAKAVFIANGLAAQLNSGVEEAIGH